MSKTKYNILNVGQDEIHIKNELDNEIDIVFPFDTIMDRWIQSLESANQRLHDCTEAVTWCKTNLKNWFKRGAPDDNNVLINEWSMDHLFYVSLREVINDQLKYDTSGNLTVQMIVDKYPSYLTIDNIDDFVVFSSGRMFRLQRLNNNINRMLDYVIAMVQFTKDPNDILMPVDFKVRDLTKLSVPDAFRHSDAWHLYTEQQAERISREEAKNLITSLKLGRDFEVVGTSVNTGISFVQLKTESATKVEGSIMKHCVASYGRDVEQGRDFIYSFRDEENFPIATVQMNSSMSVAHQVKGPKNSTIKTRYHDDIREFFLERGIQVGGDAKNFGGLVRSEPKGKKLIWPRSE